MSFITIKNTLVGSVIQLPAAKKRYFYPKSINLLFKETKPSTKARIARLQCIIDQQAQIEQSDLIAAVDLCTKGKEELTRAFITEVKHKHMHKNPDKLTALEQIFSTNITRPLKRDRSVIVSYTKAASIWRAPPVIYIDTLLAELKGFLNESNEDLERNWLLKGLLGQYQLLVIHPYRDNNGRIGRSLLCLSASSIQTFCYLSLRVLNTCKDTQYYTLMNEVTSKHNLTKDINDYLLSITCMLEKQLELC